MRAIALLAALTATASAEPRRLKLPDVVHEAVEGAAKPAKAEGVIGIDGQLATGRVMRPGRHPDAETVDKGGSVIVPPDPHDPMVLEMGTRQLRAREKIEPWLPRDLWRSVRRGADKLWDLLLPDL